eukprot:TRINITY_DN6610_c0_g1_i1.p1 TRINITY_DN6610_c0_g1~~TRINITY_DN6610_c0_g1_i1.p1  ORF type:complete len:511 (+),score=65.57 TRINITY_DN6610_c0_g1_i1:85-1617(+)
MDSLTRPEQVVEATSITNPRRPLTPIVKMAFAVGYVPLYLSTLLVSIYFSDYLTNVIRLNVANAGAIIMVGTVFDIFLDPIVGALVDHTTTSLGRRRPWLLIASIPFGYFYFMLWLDFTKMTLTEQMSYYISIFLLLKIATSSISIPHASLLPDLTSDYNLRTQLTSLKLFVSLLISILLCYFQTLLINEYTPSQLSITGHVGSKGYVVAAAIFGTVMAICPLITFLFVRENFNPNLVTPGPPTSILISVARGGRQIIDCLRNGPFMLVCLISLVSWTMLQINSSNLIYFLRFVLQIEYPLKKFQYVLAISQGALCFSMVLWMFFAKKFGKKNTFYLGRVFSVAASLIIYFLGSSSTFVGYNPSNGHKEYDYQSFYWFIFALVLGGIGNAVILLIPWAMLPDTIDYHELKFGKRNESFLYGIFVMLQKASLAIAITGSASYLESEGFISGSLTQPKSVQDALRITFCLVPLGIIVVSVIFVFFYPITKEKLAEIQEDLQQARREKMRLFE